MFVYFLQISTSPSDDALPSIRNELKIEKRLIHSDRTFNEINFWISKRQ